MAFLGLFNEKGHPLRFYLLSPVNLFIYISIYPADVPSAPSAIALLLCTDSEMVLTWRAPARNGGDPVRGYYLDQREDGTDTWREVNVQPVRERQFKVSATTRDQLTRTLKGHRFMELWCDVAFHLHTAFQKIFLSYFVQRAVPRDDGLTHYRFELTVCMLHKGFVSIH